MFESTDDAVDFFLGGMNGLTFAQDKALQDRLRHRIFEISDHERRLRIQRIVWSEARSTERQIAWEAYAVIRSVAGTMPQTKIAEALGVDRMTVRRALGKR